jgi:hypothetical protein
MIELQDGIASVLRLWNLEVPRSVRHAVRARQYGVFVRPYATDAYSFWYAKVAVEAKKKHKPEHVEWP